MKMKKPESRAENKEENSWQRCLKKIGSGREREAKSVTLFVWSRGEGGEGEQVRLVYCPFQIVISWYCPKL